MLCWICILITALDFWLQTHFSLRCLWQLCHFTMAYLVRHRTPKSSSWLISEWDPSFSLTPVFPFAPTLLDLKNVGEATEVGRENPIRFTTAYPILPRKRNYSWYPQPKSPALVKTLWGVSGMCLPAWYLDLGDHISGLPCGTLGNLLNSFET